MYGVGVNLRLGVMEDNRDAVKPSSQIRTPGGIESVSITGVEFSGLDLEKIACRSS